MLSAIGVQSVDDLFVAVPESVRLDRPVSVPPGLSEIDLDRHLRSLAARNTPASSMISVAGAGCYDHHVASAVNHVISRPEFFTAYTPYQPEVSQGTLQAMYEYQSMICSLTGMDVANASMYDGATAFVEAALMACRLTRRTRVACSATVNPEWIDTLRTYALSGQFEIVILPQSDGLTDTDGLDSVLDDQVACLLFSTPNFYGCLEESARLTLAAHEHGAMAVASVNPVLLAVLEPPSTHDVDIVVGEGQPLGGPMSFGGPGLGFFACRERHVRQMPGRLVGRTLDVDGNDAFVLTLSTREQHIRREKATSNICSNHALNALAASVHLSALGAKGLHGVAMSCSTKARYLRDRLLETGRFTSPWNRPFGYEFALRFDGDAQAMHAHMMSRGILAGVIIDAPDGTPLVLLSVTERRTRTELDLFVQEVYAL
jgi:glycine dehydrogenase subunit 1